MLIQEISKGSGKASSEVLIALAVSEFVKSCRLAPYLQFYSMIGNADTPRKKDGTMNAGTVRAVGSDYGSSITNTPDFATVALKIYGHVVKTDNAYERRGQDIGSQRALDLTNFAQSLGRFFMDSLFNDAVDATHFSGLKEQISGLSRKVVFDTVNGGTVPVGHADADLAQRDKFIEYLNAAIEDIDGGPDVAVMHGSMIARLETVGRNYLHTTNVKDIYGKDQAVISYRDVPIVNAGFKGNGTGVVIPLNETEGTSNDCTSIYLLKFGEKTDVTIATNVGLDVKDKGPVGESMATSVEMDAGLIVLN